MKAVSTFSTTLSVLTVFTRSWFSVPTCFVWWLVNKMLRDVLLLCFGMVH